VSIVNGYLIQNASWRVCFVIMAILCAVFLVLVFFFVPETAYNRPESPTSKTTSPSDESHEKEGSDKVTELQVSEVEKASGFSIQSETERPRSYWSSLKPWENRRFSDASFWKLSISPFTFVCSPIVAWGTLVYGSTSAWLVALSVSVSMLFSSPAYGYDFQAGPVGLISGVGPFIAAILGNAISGPLSDWSVKWLSRRNNGIYEPEFRLFMILPTLIFTTIGWYGWAISANLLDLWIGPAVFYSLLNFGQALASVAVVSYVVDAHADYAPEAFATINCIKNLFTFGLTYYTDPWLDKQGVLRTFCTIGGINIAICLTTIPMYIYGKRARSWVHRSSWILS